jgi:hypothetical protein
MAERQGVWNVAVITQKTASLCWEACGKMLWQWKFNNIKAYDAKAAKYLTLDKGLTEKQMDDFYKQLGLRSLRAAQGENLRHALKWTPVIFTDINQEGGHAMVASGFEDGIYTVVNPCLVQAVDFENDIATCTAGISKRKKDDVDKPLGSYIWYW